MNRWTLFVNREPSFVWANSSHFETRIKRVPEYVHTTRNVSHVRTCFFMLLWQRWCFFLCLPGMTFQMPAPALTFQTSKSNGTPKSLLIILCVQKKIYIYTYIYYYTYTHWFEFSWYSTPTIWFPPIHPMDQPITQTVFFLDPSIPRNMEVPARCSGFMKSFLSLPQFFLRRFFE